MIRRFFSRLLFWLAAPFVFTAYWWKRRREWRRITPRLWLSSGEILHQDLELYVDEGKNEFGEDFVSDFAKARDELLSLIKKQIILTWIVFAYLLSSYFKLGLDINISGFSLKYSPGVPEALLLVSNLLACYTLILQGNSYLLDSAIKAAIQLETDLELRTLYLVRYFPHEFFGSYRPFNLPHIIPNKLHRGIAKAVAILFIVLFALTGIVFAATNFFLLIHYLWLHPNFGIWSYLLLSYILVLGVTAIAYVTLTRARLPYLDFTTNQELAVLEQANQRRLA